MMGVRLMRDAAEFGAPSPPDTSPFTFASLVEPLGVETFMKDYHGKREWIHHGRPDRFEWLLSWPRLNELIRDQRPASPRFRLMKAGRSLPEGIYQRTVQTLRGPLRLLDPSQLLAELRGGATLVWDAIDQGHPPIRAIKQAVERALRALVFVNMYASWGTLGGVGDHWDDHDVFVVQVIGRKNWRVHPATRKWPMPDEDFGDEAPVEYAHEWMLEAGGVLYLPRGWWHRVTPVNEPSLHLTIGVLRPTNADFLLWLLDRAKASDLVRQDFPITRDDAARTAHAAALRSVLEEWLQPSSIALYGQEQDDTHYLDPRPTLQAVGECSPEAWDPNSEALFLSTRAQIQDRGADVALVVAGTEWRAPKEAEPLLSALVNGQPVRIGTLLEGVPGHLISDLVTAGVIALT
jgi:ribosomal protein L16 Arg81 hydroxylase